MYQYTRIEFIISSVVIVLSFFKIYGAKMHSFRKYENYVTTTFDSAWYMID